MGAAKTLLSAEEFDNYPFEEDTAIVVSFGKTYYMTTKVGWDNITGVGTPNAKAFADWFAPATAAKK